MGYGSDKTYEMTWERPVLVLLGNRYSLDADALDEADMADEPLPQATFDELKNCSSQIFLIPKGDRPFSCRATILFTATPIFETFSRLPSGKNFSAIIARAAAAVTLTSGTVFIDFSGSDNLLILW